MFGNHKLEDAERIAREKSKELNKECTVFPVFDDNGSQMEQDGAPLYTIGIRIKALTGDEFTKLIRAGGGLSVDPSPETLKKTP